MDGRMMRPSAHRLTPKRAVIKVTVDDAAGTWGRVYIFCYLAGVLLSATLDQMYRTWIQSDSVATEFAESLNSRCSMMRRGTAWHARSDMLRIDCLPLPLS